MEEATFLTKFASRVTIVHRRGELRASAIMVRRAEENPKIDFLLNTVVSEIEGDGEVTGVVLNDAVTGESRRMPVDGVFVAVGHHPNTDLFAGQLDLDAKGYIVLPGPGTATSVPGVFAAGDVADHVYRQAITSAGAGCMAALDVEKFLDDN